MVEEIAEADLEEYLEHEQGVVQPSFGVIQKDKIRPIVDWTTYNAKTTITEKLDLPSNKLVAWWMSYIMFDEDVSCIFETSKEIF